MLAEPKPVLAHDGLVLVMGDDDPNGFAAPKVDGVVEAPKVEPVVFAKALLPLGAPKVEVGAVEGGDGAWTADTGAGPLAACA